MCLRIIKEIEKGIKCNYNKNQNENTSWSGETMKVLVVEDDEMLKKAMRYQLEQAGMQIEDCSFGDEACFMALQANYDVIILDRMIPELDGLSVLKKIRKEGVLTPVIMVTAMSGVDDRIDGLESGADDYLVKPFEMRELTARIKALGRRPNEFRLENKLMLGELMFNLDTKVISAGEQSCELTVREAQLLEYFLRNKNQTVPRNLILSRVWGTDGDVTESNLDNYIYFIRRRLKGIGAKVKVITVRGIGYRLEEG